MKKSLLALAVLGTLAGVASAQSSVTIYGRVDESFAKPMVSKDKQIADNGTVGGSRLGFKGTEDLGNGLSAVFRFEHGFNPDTGTAAATQFWNRYSMVGLSHAKFGTLSLGRQENGAWDVISSFDPFGGETVGELRDIGSALRIANWNTGTPFNNTLDVRRWDNSVRYDVGYQGFKGSVSVAEATAQNKPVAAGGSYTAGPLYVGVGYEKISPQNGKLWIVGGAYDFGMAKLYANYAGGTTGGTTSTGDRDVKGFLVGATAPYGALLFKAGYAQSKVDWVAGAQTYKKASAGVDYNLSKRTKLYADYARIGGDIAANSLADDNRNGYDVGIRHSF
ncbi:porin [Ideonella sp. B508-1]|uniref:porin n=1 Tax=Ideonella sp. B508-1 TaxID=137716 RepID=UPI000347CFB4|nr:porin [Ideonella sp. B508-1]